MKIEINIDVEAIVADEIRKCVREALVINNTKFNKSYDEAIEKAFEEEKAKTYIQDDVLVPVDVSEEQHKQIEEVCKDKVINVGTSVQASDEPEYEYAPRKDKRRNKVEMALHDAELAVKRRLTPEEKVKIKAAMEREEEQEQKELEAAKTRMKAEELAKKLTEDTSSNVSTNSLFNPEPEKENSELIKEETSWALPNTLEEVCNTQAEDEEAQIAMEKASTGEEEDEDSSAWFSTKVATAGALFKPSIDDPVIPKADPLTDVNSLFKD